MLGRILIVDDDPDMRLVLREHLEPEGFEVLDAGNGAEMRALIEREEVDLVILDLQLPDEDGLNLAKVLREKTDAGIVMLTGKGTSVDMVVGLEVGADDYVAKPFKARGLLARIRSVLRRTKEVRSAKPGTGGGIARFDGWRFESAFQRLTDPEGNDTVLTAGESRLLQTLIDNAGQTVSRETLHREALGYDMQSNSRNIDVLVGRLRRKLESDDARENLIKSIRGIGYEFTGNIQYE
ncbi:MAG: response regulator transcription factor [Alphaproteobacteria bacterium]|jgi:DNA-binding response OmpR family regulator|nr:response regulator transcription factor [Alphaproteobacteria bacterium]